MHGTNFEIPDNSSRILSGVIDPNGPAAYRSTLPVARTREVLRGAGIPCRISDSAGTFLCNALMYAALDHCGREQRDTRCSFIHLPYLPGQVAGLLNYLAEAAEQELHQRAGPADITPSELATVIDFLIRKKEGQFRVIWSGFAQAVSLLFNEEVHMMDCCEPMVFIANARG